MVSSTPSRRPRAAAATPGSRTPRAKRTITAPTTPATSPSKSPTKGKGKQLATPSPVKPKTPTTNNKRPAPARRTATAASSSRDAEQSDSSHDSVTGDDDDDEMMDEEDDEHAQTKGAKSTLPTEISLLLPELASDATIRRTASDVYFYLSSKPSRTSSNVFSSLLPQLSPEECASLTSPSSQHHITKKHPELLASLRAENEAQYARWAFELAQGFNILLYGYGSKLRLINDFAKRFCAKSKRKGGEQHVVVVINGFWSPAVTIRAVLEAIEQHIPEINGISSQDATSTGGIEQQTRRIYDYFSPTPSSSPSPPPRLFLMIHNIEYSAQLMRLPRARACLALLASNPRIHLVASVDNVHSGVMWTTAEILGRKHDIPEAQDNDGEDDEEEEDMEVDDDIVGDDEGHGKAKRKRKTAAAARRIPSSRSFAWLWHETTTFEPYEIELSFRDLSILPRSKGAGTGGAGGGVHGGGDGLGGEGGVMINETAAKQVLASVTQKAKRLFDLLGRAQLSSSSGDGDDGGDGGNDNDNEKRAASGMAYELLALRAREEFLATSEGALRALLTEFRDHGLVVQSYNV